MVKMENLCLMNLTKNVAYEFRHRRQRYKKAHQVESEGFASRIVNKLRHRNFFRCLDLY